LRLELVSEGPYMKLGHELPTRRVSMRRLGGELREMGDACWPEKPSYRTEGLCPYGGISSREYVWLIGER
jgi:hypothetical protein